MSVEELVRRIRLHKEYIGGTNSAYRGVPELCDQIADKLEELTAENSTLRCELSATVAERRRAQEACQQISEKAEAALADRDKEIAALHSLVRQAKGWVADHARQWHEKADQTLARNAGGKDAQ